MKREERTGRLLLTLLTAFIMVFGVFGAAVTTQPWLGEPGQFENKAVSELDSGKGEIGDAPISADFEEPQEQQGNEVEKDKFAMTPDGSGELVPIDLDELPDRDEKKHEEVEGYTLPSSPSESSHPDVPEQRGTRYPVGTTVDAKGPYGTSGNPYYEGESVDFTADINGDDINNYQFRWDVTGDGEFDTGWSAYGDPDYTHMYRDDMKGEALCQAWD
jgi:hypothetical protein